MGGFRPQLLLDAAEAIPHFDRPVLLVWGDSCEFFPAGDAERLASDFPRRDAARRAGRQDVGPGRRSGGAGGRDRRARSRCIGVDPGVAARLGSAAHPLQEEVGHGSSRPPCPSRRRRNGQRPSPSPCPPRHTTQGWRWWRAAWTTRAGWTRGRDPVGDGGRARRRRPVRPRTRGDAGLLRPQRRAHGRRPGGPHADACPEGPAVPRQPGRNVGHGAVGHLVRAEGALDDHRARRPVDDAGPAAARGPGHGQAVPARR